MTREQSKRIQEVEKVVDYLCGVMDTMSHYGNECYFGSLTDYVDGSKIGIEMFAEDVDAYNRSMHNFAMSQLIELKDKYLKMYAAL